MDESERIEIRKVFVKKIAKEVAVQLGLPAAPTIIFDVQEWRKLRQQRKHPWHITVPKGQACVECAAIFIPLPTYEFSDWRSWASLADFTKHEVAHLRFPSDDHNPYFERVLKRVLAGEQFPSPNGKRQLGVCKRLIENQSKSPNSHQNSWTFCFLLTFLKTI